MSRPLLAALVALLSVSFAISPLFVRDFGGFDANQFPVPQYKPPIQPAGYAFAIWGVIYLWLIVGMLWGWWKYRDDTNWTAMRGPLAISLAIGTIWLPVAQASPIWAAILIWVMQQGALLALYRSPKSHRWTAVWPVALYAGWLTAAACVSLGLLAAGYGYTSETTAAYVFLLLALVFASGVQNTLKRAPVFGVGVVWALIAVMVQNISSHIGVAGLAAGGALALLVPTWRAWQAEQNATDTERTRKL